MSLLEQNVFERVGIDGKKNKNLINYTNNPATGVVIGIASFMITCASDLDHGFRSPFVYRSSSAILQTICRTSSIQYLRLFKADRCSSPLDGQPACSGKHEAQPHVFRHDSGDQRCCINRGQQLLSTMKFLLAMLCMERSRYWNLRASDRTLRHRWVEERPLFKKQKSADGVAVFPVA